MDDKDLRIQQLLTETQWLRQELANNWELIRALRAHIETMNTHIDIMQDWLQRYEHKEGKT